MILRLFWWCYLSPKIVSILKKTIKSNRMKSDCHFYNDAKKNYKIIFFCSSLPIAIDDQHPYDDHCVDHRWRWRRWWWRMRGMHGVLRNNKKIFFFIQEKKGRSKEAFAIRIFHYKKIHRTPTCKISATKKRRFLCMFV